MAAYKDEERGTWYVSFYYEDWTGAKKRKVKRGFRTKKEALNFEAEYKRTAKADMDMTMGEFVEVYFRDKSQSLKDRSIKNKMEQRCSGWYLPFLLSQQFLLLPGFRL